MVWTGCRLVRSAVGESVSLKGTMRRWSRYRTTSTQGARKVAVVTVRKSTATIAPRWLLTYVCQDSDDGPGHLTTSPNDLELPDINGAVRGRDLRPPGVEIQNLELVAQREVLECRLPPRAECSDRCNCDGSENPGMPWHPHGNHDGRKADGSFESDDRRRRLLPWSSRSGPGRCRPGPSEEHALSRLAAPYHFSIVIFTRYVAPPASSRAMYSPLATCPPASSRPSQVTLCRPAGQVPAASTRTSRPCKS